MSQCYHIVQWQSLQSLLAFPRISEILELLGGIKPPFPSGQGHGLKVTTHFKEPTTSERIKP